MKATTVLLALIPSLVCVLAVHADTITGDIAVSGSGTFTSSSLQLNSLAAVGSSTGDLSDADSGSFALLSTATLTGLSTGTSPVDRYDFALTSITETNSTAGDFTGIGILTDTTGTFSPTVATFTLSNSGQPGGPSGAGFTLSADGIAATAAPEPSVWAMFAFGCGFLALFRLRRRRA